MNRVLLTSSGGGSSEKDGLVLSKLPLEEFKDDLVVDEGVVVVYSVRVASRVELDVEVRNWKEKKTGKSQPRANNAVRSRGEETLTPLGEIGLQYVDWERESV